MKHIFLYLITICFCAVTAHAQNDTITHQKRGLGKVYMKDGRVLTLKTAENTFKENEAAMMQFKKARTNTTVATIFAGAGGGVIGYQLGYALGSGTSVNPGIIGVGLGLIAISIPFNIAGQKHMSDAVHIYNASRRRSAMHFDPDFHLAVTGNGIGLRIGF